MGRLRSRLYKTDRARDFDHERVRSLLQKCDTRRVDEAHVSMNRR